MSHFECDFMDLKTVEFQEVNVVLGYGKPSSVVIVTFFKSIRYPIDITSPLPAPQTCF